MFKLILQAILLVFLSNHYVLSNKLFLRKTIHVYRFVGKCPGYNNLTVIFHNGARFTHENSSLRINLNFTVQKDTSKDIKFKMNINRCLSREALDTCEMYPEISISNVGEILELRVPPFNQILNKVHPRVHCPVKKNSYAILNAMLDDAITKLLPIDGYYIKGTALMIDRINGTYETVGCFGGELKLVPV